MSHKARCYGTPEGIRTPDLLVRRKELFELLMKKLTFLVLNDHI